MLSGMTSLSRLFHFKKFMYLHQLQIPLSQKELYLFVKTNQVYPGSRFNLSLPRHSPPPPLFLQASKQSLYYRQTNSSQDSWERGEKTPPLVFYRSFYPLKMGCYHRGVQKDMVFFHWPCPITCINRGPRDRNVL